MEVVLLYGGKSAEHEISVLTAKDIMANLDYEEYNLQPVYITREGEWRAAPKITGAPLANDTNFYLEAAEKASFRQEPEKSLGVVVKPCDVLNEDTIAFPALHGPNGEDGTIQGLFESLQVPYAGAGVLASAAGMDKIVSKQLFLQAQIPQVPFVHLTREQYEEEQSVILAQIEGKLIYPLFIKPANMGSSIGISKANNREEMLSGLKEAFRYDTRLIVEQGVEAREIEVGVIGNHKPEVSVVGELIKAEGFYDYEEKYINNKTQMAIPADLPEELSAQIQTYAKEAYLAIAGNGLTRCDFFLTHNDNVYINEVNTMPGFTEFSMFPQLWQASGLSYQDMLSKLLRLGLERFDGRRQLENK